MTTNKALSGKRVFVAFEDRISGPRIRYASTDALCVQWHINQNPSVNLQLGTATYVYTRRANGIARFDEDFGNLEHLIRTAHT